MLAYQLFFVAESRCVGRLLVVIIIFIASKAQAFAGNNIVVKSKKTKKKSKDPNLCKTKKKEILGD